MTGLTINVVMQQQGGFVLQLRQSESIPLSRGTGSASEHVNYFSR